ncbi:MAG: RluA family pseudouridine synthase [Verrucomicrobia bacterium]|nr:RluA family pseudouridine synthase [Verrucomicrobiota bacterium]
MNRIGSHLFHFSLTASDDTPSASVDKLFDILHEDGDLLVVNKPAGLVCHPTKGDERSSLIGRMRLHLGPVGQPHLINRLDRETSGLVIAAKHPEAARELGRIWETRAVRKEYLAIVHGHLRDGQGLIDAPLGKDDRSRVAIKDCVRPDGAAAQTEFWVERRLSRLEQSASAFTLLRVVPRTGRKHQIRIHLAHIGHAIVGDKIYGGDEDLYLALVEDRLTEEQRARLILPHQALHAAAVQFCWHQREVSFCASPEPWFEAFARGYA